MMMIAYVYLLWVLMMESSREMIEETEMSFISVQRSE